MAQSRFIKYRDPINSFEANEKYAGIIPPGIFTGFDNATGHSGLTFQLNHETTGEVFTKKDGSATTRRGIWTTKQGIVVKEDAAITVTITANLNNYERWDLLVGVHSYDELNPGGIPASYEVIPGGNKTDPVLTTPLDQTVLGRIRVPANAITAAGIVWERARVQGLGGKPVAMLDSVNRFTNQLQEYQASASIINESGISKSVIQSLDGANSFLITSGTGYLDLLPDRPAGTTITITFDQNTVLRGFNNQIDGSNNMIGYSLGYRPILVDPGAPSYSPALTKGDTITLRKVNTSWTHPSRPFGDYWVVVSIASNISIRRIAERDSIEYVNDDFLGIRYNASGGTYVTDGLLKKLNGPDVQEVITLSPPILPGNSNGIIKGRVYGSAPWNYGSSQLEEGEWPVTSNNRLIMEIQGIELVLVNGGPPTGNDWEGSYVGFEFEIKMLRGVPTIMYKQQAYGTGGGTQHIFSNGLIGQPHKELIEDYYGGQAFRNDGWSYKPLPTLNMTIPIDIKFKTPLMPVSLTATQYSNWANATQKSNLNEFWWNALRLLEFKVIRL